MNCVYCNYPVLGRRHEFLCPYNPDNTRKILIYLRDYVLNESSFNKNLKPFPRPREFDEFCRKNKISRLKTISRRYLHELRLNDWLVELLEYGINRGIVLGDDFPYFLQYIYDAWIFNTNTEYQKIYKESIIYEDGYGFWNEIVDTGHKEKVLEFRQAGVPFLQEKREVRQYFRKEKQNGIAESK